LQANGLPKNADGSTYTPPDLNKDSDGDGVPDAQDPYPNDPTRPGSPNEYKTGGGSTGSGYPPLTASPLTAKLGVPGMPTLGERPAVLSMNIDIPGNGSPTQIMSSNPASVSGPAGVALDSLRLVVRAGLAVAMSYAFLMKILTVLRTW